MKAQISEFARNDICPRCNKTSCNHWTPREPVMPSYLMDTKKPRPDIEIDELTKLLGIDRKN